MLSAPAPGAGSRSENQFLCDSPGPLSLGIPADGGRLVGGRFQAKRLAKGSCDFSHYLLVRCTSSDGNARAADLVSARKSSVVAGCVRNRSSHSVVLTSPQRSLAGEPGGTTSCRRRLDDGEHAKETLYREGFLRTQSRRRALQVVYARCAGRDVHKKTVSACVLVRDTAGARQQEVRVFGTFTGDLLALADW